jgi:hypothetical protein
MNASLRMAVLSLSVLGLSACAGMEARSTYVPEPQEPSIMDQDAAYIARVERIARQRGIEVQWVNPPTKSASQLAQEAGQPR